MAGEISYQVGCLVGRIFTSALETTVEGGEDIARGMITAERESRFAGQVSKALIKGGNFLTDRVASAIAKIRLNVLGEWAGSVVEGTVRGVEGLGSSVTDVGAQLGERIYPSLTPVIKDSTAAERFLNGGEEDGVTLARRLTMLREVASDLEHGPGADELATEIAQGTRQLNLLRANFIAGAITDVQDKVQTVAGDFGFKYYDNFKDQFTTEGGLTAEQFARVQNVAVPIVGSYFQMVTGRW